MLDQDTSRRRAFGARTRRRCRSPKTSTCRAAQNLKAPYFTNYVKQLLVDSTARHASSAAGCACGRRSTCALQQDARNAISKWLDRRRARGRARRDRSAQRPRARDDRRQQLPRVASSTSRCRASASRVVVQAVRARGRARGRGRARRRASCRSRSRSTLDGTIWPVHNYEGRTSADRPAAGDDPLRQQRLRAAHAGRRPGGRRATARKLGITSPLEPYLSIGLGARGRQPARDGARVRGVRERRPPGRRRADRQPPARDRRRRRQARDDVECGGARPLQPVVSGASCDRTRRRPSARSFSASSRRGRARARRCRIVRPPARRARPRTTATPGSSGYTPQLVTAVWVGYPDKLVPMTTQFHGDPVAGGTYPGADLEDVHGDGADAVPDGARREYFPPPPSFYGPTRSGRVARRAPAAGQRQLPRRADARVHAAIAPPTRRRTASRTRWTSRASSATR